MTTVKVFILAILFINIGEIISLSCYCKPAACKVLTDKDCPFGVGMDACHCCHECKKGPGEKCGGLFNLDGICGDGLVCHRNKNHSEDIFDLNGICLSK
ncbi:UNVERIFIED_CONTAM: hypothetical protein RMT77_011691 [Armadillidium vulgare]